MRRAISLLLLLSVFATVRAQQRLTLVEAESLFVARYAGLLAEAYNIKTAEALVIQARVYPVPVASAEANLVNPERPTVFDVGLKGQKALAVQQVLLLGHKKQHEIEWAKSNVKLAQLSYEQLLHDLRLELRQAFFTVFFEQKKQERLQVQADNIDTLVNAYAVQAEKGHLPLSDVVRLRALALALKNDLLDIQQTLQKAEERLRTLTASPEDVVPVVAEDRLYKRLSEYVWPSYTQALDTLLRYNPEFKIANYLIENQELMLKWQRALGVPDLNIGLSYDQRGGAFRNQVNLTATLPLPLWAINKGNIQAAELQVQQQTLAKVAKQEALSQALRTALAIWQQRQAQYNLLSATASQQLQQVYGGVLANFQKSNVSIMAFTDFMESYSRTILQMNDMAKQLCEAGESVFGLTQIDWLAL